MAVTYITASTIAANNTTTTLSMTMPTVQDNDIAIGFIYADSDQVHTFPANWTKFVEQSGTTARDTVAWKRVTASESGGTVDVTKPTDDNVLFCGVIYIFRGCTTSGSPIDSSTSQANNTAATTIAYPTLDPTAACHVVF